MANGMYAKGRENILNGSIALSGDIRFQPIDTGAYTVNLSTHTSLSDVPGGSRIGTAAALAGKTYTNGTFSANNLTITGLTGTSIEAGILYLHTGVDATALLIAYYDTGDFPFTPGGGDYTFRWNDNAGASGAVFAWS